MSKQSKLAAIFALAVFLFQVGGLSCIAMDGSVIEAAACECSEAQLLDAGSDSAGCQMDCQCLCNLSLSLASTADFIQPGETRFRSILTVPADLKEVSASVFQPPKPSL